MSDFGRLRSYGRSLIPVHALVWTASNSWCVIYSGYSLANFSQLQTAVLVISTLGWYLSNGLYSPGTAAAQSLSRLLVFRVFRKGVCDIRVHILISVRLLRSRCHLHFHLKSMQIWFMCTGFVTVTQFLP